MNTVSAAVSTIEPLTDFVYKIVLKPDTKIEFDAGQYLMLHLSDDDKRPFSIACAPNGDQVELHIGASGADDWAMQAIEHMRQNDEITLSLPHGEAQLREDSLRPIILIAGGTGFSYINSILQRLHQLSGNRQVLLYWGVKTQEDAYHAESLSQLADSWPELTFNLVVENAAADWQGHTGYVHKAVMQDIVSFADYDIYVAGRFDMVGIVRDDFLKQGADVSRMFGDAFAFIK